MHHIQCDPSAARSQRVDAQVLADGTDGAAGVQEFVLYSVFYFGERRSRSTVDCTRMKIGIKAYPK